MGATNALPNLKFRPCAASAGGGTGGGRGGEGGLPFGGLGGAGEWECEFVQRAPTYGTDGNLATHIVSVKILDGVTGRMPLQISVAPVYVYRCKLGLNRYIYTSLQVRFQPVHAYIVEYRYFCLFSEVRVEPMYMEVRVDPVCMYSFLKSPLYSNIM
jgi:hypothetical protein